MREILIRVPVYKFEELGLNGKWTVMQNWIMNHGLSRITGSEMSFICDQLHLEFRADGSSDFTEVKLNKYQKEE